MTDTRRLLITLKPSERAEIEAAQVRAGFPSLASYIRAMTLKSARGSQSDRASLGLATVNWVTSADFILDAIDNVHDMDVTLRDYAAAVGLAQRKALGIIPKGAGQ